MANATASREDLRKDGVLTAYKMAATKIFKGTLVSLNAAGFVKKGSDTVGEKFVGIAYEEVDNSGGAAGDKVIRVWQIGSFEFALASTATQATVGVSVYLSDDQTVDLAAVTTSDVLVGRVVEFVSASTVRVAINPHA